MDSAGGRYNSSITGRRNWLSISMLALAVALFSTVVAMRLLAPRMDHSLVNILTLVIGFFGWLTAVFGIALARLPKWIWRALLGIPLLAIAALLSLYRFARVDSELIPHFRARWESPTELVPSARPKELTPINASRIDPRPTDYPQFLGPNRNATITNVSLETDWSQHQPRIAWKQPIGAGWSGFAIQGDVAITIEQRGMQECVTAYDIADGELLWVFCIDARHSNALGGLGPRSTPTIHANRVFAHIATGKIVCLELASGRLVWQVDLLQIAGTTQADAEVAVSWGRTGSPLVVGDCLVVPLGGAKNKVAASLIGLKLDTGTEQWRAGEDQISYSSPTLATLRGQQQILSINETTMTSHDPFTGKQLWSTPWPGASDGSANVSQPIPLDDSRVLMSKAYGEGAQVIEVSRTQDGNWSSTVLWKDTSLLKTKFTNCVLKDHFAYGLSDGILECVDTRDGHREWKQGRYRHGQVLLVSGVLLISSEAGELILVEAKPDKFRELSRIQVIGDVTWNTPALSGNRLLMRNAEEAACVLLPLREQKSPN